jgi:penicillin-binding protein 1C
MPRSGTAPGGRPAAGGGRPAKRSAIARIVRVVLGFALILLGVAELSVLGVAWSRASLRGPEPSRMLVDRNGAFLGEIRVPEDGRLGFWAAGEHRCAPGETGEDCLPERIVRATLAIEDRRFDEHPGVDVRAIGRAVQQNVGSGERISGASTIAMQLARLQDPGPRTWTRKATEAVTALLLVELHGRDAVLAAYLRLAPYGNNVHGVRYAARRYFRKPLADLSWAEAALLAALPQAPGTMNPYDVHGRRRADARAVRILDRLVQDGSITGEERDRAVDELSRTEFGARPMRPEAAIHPVIAMDGDPDLPLGDDPEVQTTLDLGLQEHVEHELLDAVFEWRDRGAGQAAAVILDRRTMAVRASVGSIGFEGTHAGSIDFTRVPRTPGSTLKPLLYALALDRGVLRPGQVLDDLAHGPQGIRNADDDFLGPMLPRSALANSRNVPAVELAERVGLDALFGFWGELGLHDGTERASTYGLGVAIGGMPVRLVDLATAYGALANDGELQAPRWVEGANSPSQRVFSADHARLVTLWLADPVARTPTFARGSWGELPFPAAMKTGTSPDFRDAWAVGWDDRHLVAVWVGHPDWRPMKGLSGHKAAARLVHALLEQTHVRDGSGFLPPESWTEAEICSLTGSLAGPLCDAPRGEWFPPGQAPAHTCAAHRLHDGRVVVDLPNRYGPWLQRRGVDGAPRTPVRRDALVAVELLSPRDGDRVIRDPEVPADRSTLRLAASVDPPGDPVVWLVDGEPFAVVEYPYEVRWPIEPGRHTFEARLAWRPERSRTVAVEAR